MPQVVTRGRSNIARLEKDTAGFALRGHMEAGGKPPPYPRLVEKEAEVFGGAERELLADGRHSCPGKERRSR